MKMNFSTFSMTCFFLVVLVLWSETKVGFSQSTYISWYDLTVGDHDIVVDKNGGGHSTTVQGAVDMVPENSAQRVKIHIRPGVYSEKVHIPASKPHISFIGDENRASHTIITWHDKASDSDNHGGQVGTWNSATVTVESDYFCASRITIQNYGGQDPQETNARSQAVALRIAGDKAVFYKVFMLGVQDTLLDESGSHLFLQCFIQGAVDFIFGNGRSLYKQCTISLVNAYSIVAQGRASADEDTGFSFVNCKVTGTGNAALLARAWGEYSRVIFAYTELDANVLPGGWSDWGNPSRDNHVMFGEYKNTGRGAERSRRVGYSKEMTYLEAKPFLDESFINGGSWLKL